MRNREKNCLSFWFPRLRASGVSVPRTEVVRTDLELIGVCDGQAPEGFDAFIADLRAAGERIGPAPWFLRTGQGSGKHDWGHTCYVADPSRLDRHVANLVEWSHLADMIGLPTDVWAVREFLPLQSEFRATFYGGMPVAREYRAFMVGGRLQCLHAYWPDYAVEGGEPDVIDWRERLARINEVTPGVWEIVRRLVGRIAPQFADAGDWSIDVCPTIDGRWLVTDMAAADASFHWPDCPFCPEGQRHHPRRRDHDDAGPFAALMPPAEGHS